MILETLCDLGSKNYMPRVCNSCSMGLECTVLWVLYPECGIIAVLRAQSDAREFYIYLMKGTIHTP